MHVSSWSQNNAKPWTSSYRLIPASLQNSTLSSLRQPKWGHILARRTAAKSKPCNMVLVWRPDSGDEFGTTKRQPTLLGLTLHGTFSCPEKGPGEDSRKRKA